MTKLRAGRVDRGKALKEETLCPWQGLIVCSNFRSMRRGQSAMSAPWHLSFRDSGCRSDGTKSSIPRNDGVVARVFSIQHLHVSPS